MERIRTINFTETLKKSAELISTLYKANLGVSTAKATPFKTDSGTRLEPINTTYEIEESLSGRVKDPLWLLGRSWQLLEYRAENGGQLVRSEVSHKSDVMDYFYDSTTGAFDDFPIAVPLEKVVEEEMDDPKHVKPRFWNNKKLEYEFGLTNDNLDENGNDLPSEDRIILEAKNYTGRDLDWYNFVIQQKGKIHGNERDEVFFPSQIDIPGIPHHKWWTIEDSRINVGNIQRYHENYITMLLVNFALYSSSNWYMMSLNQQIGSIREITRFKVMDSFGVVSDVSPIEDETPNNVGWEIFTLTRYDGQNSGSLHYLPNSISLRALKSEPIEDIDFIRDEMANLVWAIEKKYQINPSGFDAGGFGGMIHNRNDDIKIPEKVEEIRYFKVAETDADEGLRENYNNEAGEPGYNYLGPLPYYRLKSFVPDNWIPYIASIIDGGALNGQIKLRRGRSMEEVDLVEPPYNGKQYLGKVISESTNVNENEVSRAGTRITRIWQIARDVNGDLVSWKSRQRSRVQGHKSSGLQFDYLEDV